MAKFGDRVKETTDTTGTGTLDLSGAPTGFLGFADEFNTADNEISYLIVDDPDSPTEWEVGKGTLTTGTPNTLSRDTVERSTNADAKVSFTAGTKTVIATPTSADLTALAAGFPVSTTDNAIARYDGTSGSLQNTTGWTIGDTNIVNGQDNVLQRPMIKDYGETRTAPASASNVLTLDIENGNVFNTTLTENVTTLTISNPTGAGDSPVSLFTCSFTLIVAQNGTGGWAITWPAAIKWAAGLPPVVTTDASAIDVFTFTTTDGGTTWYGFTAGQDMA